MRWGDAKRGLRVGWVRLVCCTGQGPAEARQGLTSQLGFWPSAAACRAGRGELFAPFAPLICVARMLVSWQSVSQGGADTRHYGIMTTLRIYVVNTQWLKVDALYRRMEQ